eukprot:XP_001693273.1 predicted protein [Chlamydomonas reinhardtii]
MCAGGRAGRVVPYVLHVSAHLCTGESARGFNQFQAQNQINDDRVPWLTPQSGAHFGCLRLLFLWSCGCNPANVVGVRVPTSWTRAAACPWMQLGYQVRCMVPWMGIHCSGVTTNAYRMSMS